MQLSDAPPRVFARIRALGLRCRINLIVLPILVAGMALLVAIDYRHEYASVSAAHAQHDAAPVAIDPATSAGAAALRSLAAHVAGGLVMVIGLALALNAAMWRLVLRPLRDVEVLVAQMRRGHWRGLVQHAPTNETNELTRFATAFEQLGLCVFGAMVQGLGAERRATTALLAMQVVHDVEPELDRLGRAIGALAESDPESVKNSRHEVAVAAAHIRRAVRRLEHLVVAPLAVGTRRPV
jgi:HAMP domain-containing protein